MKKIIIVLFLITPILSSIGQSKEYRTDPKRKDNLIIIIDKGTPEENFISFGKFLIEKGFTFKSKDKDFLTLTTDERNSKGAYKYALRISFKDSTIFIRPQNNYLLMGSSIGNMQIQWADWKYSNKTGYAYKVFSPILREYNGQLFFTKID